MEKDKEAVASRGLFKVPGNPTALFKKVKSQRSLKKELQESSTTTTSTATTTTINETPPPEEEPKKKRKKRFLFKGLLKGSGMSREERKALKKKRKKEGDAQGEDSGSPEDSAGVEGEDEEEITTRVPRAPPTPQKEITRSGGKATPKRLPGEQHPSKRKKGKLNLLSADVVSTETGGNLEKRELLNHLLSILIEGKVSYPVYLDLSDVFDIRTDEFLFHCPDVITQLDLSYNSLQDCQSIQHLHKLKRLWVNHNQLSSISFRSLDNLVLLSLHHNNLEILNQMSNLQKLVNLSLSHNKLTGGFAELGQLKSLKVLDISYNNIRAESTAQFFDSILCHIKKLPKLKYLVSMGNTFEKLIPHYRLFIISELPKLTTLDLQPVLKEERSRAKKLAALGQWGGGTSSMASPRGVAILDNQTPTPDPTRNRSELFRENSDISHLLQTSPMDIESSPRTRPTSKSMIFFPPKRGTSLMTELQPHDRQVVASMIQNYERDFKKPPPTSPSSSSLPFMEIGTPPTTPKGRHRKSVSFNSNDIAAFVSTSSNQEQNNTDASHPNNNNNNNNKRLSKSYNNNKTTTSHQQEQPRALDMYEEEEEEVVAGGRARSLSFEFEQLLQTLDHPLEPDLLPLPEDEALTSIESTPIDHRTMLTPRSRRRARSAPKAVSTGLEELMDALDVVNSGRLQPKRRVSPRDYLLAGNTPNSLGRRHTVFRRSAESQPSFSPFQPLPTQPRKSSLPEENLVSPRGGPGQGTSAEFDSLLNELLDYQPRPSRRERQTQGPRALSNEFLLNVFGMLDLPSLKQVCCVCISWRQIGVEEMNRRKESALKKSLSNLAAKEGRLDSPLTALMLDDGGRAFRDKFERMKRETPPPHHHHPNSGGRRPIEGRRPSADNGDDVSKRMMVAKKEGAERKKGGMHGAVVVKDGSPPQQQQPNGSSSLQKVPFAFLGFAVLVLLALHYLF